MGLHDRDYYRNELTKRDGWRAIEFRWRSSWLRWKAAFLGWFR